MLLDQAALVLAACALASAALRVAARVGAAGSVIERVLVAAPLAAAFAVCWTLALGLAGLAGSVFALAAGPIAAWALTRWLVPGPTPSLTTELIERWNRMGPAQRAGALALAGAAVGVMVEVGVQPGLDIDALTYHLPDVVGWLHSGHAGAVQTFSYDYPTGYYPVTNEVLLTWVLGISRSFAPIAAWSTAVAVLALLGLWRLLRVLRVPSTVAGAALAAYGTLPILVLGLNYDAPGTDLPAVAWLACTAALSAGAGERPALLGPALIAAGLGVGTKTTVAPLAAVALLAGAWRARARLRPARTWLAAGAVGGLLVGAPWYVRNAVTHGWPLWPFSSGPTGNPVPRTMRVFDISFLSRPAATVKAVGNGYLDQIAGGLGLIAGVLAVPLVARSRAALAAAALAALSVLVWASAPYTGVTHVTALQQLAVATARYLLPGLGACLVAIGVVARDAGRVGRRLVLTLLAGATVGSVVSDLHFGFPTLPSPGYPLAGAAAGAVIGALVGRLIRPPVWRVMIPVTAAVALAFSAPGWLWRESEDHSYGSAILSYLMNQPSFRTGSQPISSAPFVVASFAGPHLNHPVELIPPREPCARVQARVRRGWVVLSPFVFVDGVTAASDAAYCLRGDHPVYSDQGVVFVYGR